MGERIPQTLSIGKYSRCEKEGFRAGKQEEILCQNCHRKLRRGHNRSQPNSEKIPMSRERQERLLHEQIDEITEGIAS